MEAPNKILMTQRVPSYSIVWFYFFCVIATDTLPMYCITPDHQTQWAAAEQHEKLTGKPGHTYVHLSSTSCSVVNTCPMFVKNLKLP